MLTTFLFWNLQKNSLQDRLARIVATYHVDVVILAECSFDPDALCTTLRQQSGVEFFHPFSLSTKIKIVSRFKPDVFEDRLKEEGTGLTIRQLSVGKPPGILLAAVHFPGKVNLSENDQTLLATQLSTYIVEEERRLNVTRTVLVGDLNMNPFEPGVTGAQALHAVMTQRIATRGERTVRGQSYRFFYNPMWGLWGDRKAGPPGTYYLSSSKPINYFWAMYDQVLLRPELMSSLHALHILDSDGTNLLLTRSGLPDKKRSSDHLPILFTLDL